MRVLLFSQYFPPEVTAASARLRALAEGLARRGHEVEVVCEVPNHPEGIVRKDYRGHLVQRRTLDGFSVRYVWVRASPVKTQRSRMLFYGTYALMATLAGMATRRPDIILVSSPPLPAAMAAATVARMRRVPWVFDVRDLWPEAAVALGELTNPRVIGAMERLERKLYASAEAIVTVTEPFRSEICAKGLAAEKVTIIPNGTTDAWIEAGEREEDRTVLEMPEDRFVLTYAGNVGLAQGMHAAVEAAARLDEGFQLQIVGSGPCMDDVQRQAEDLPADRVVFRGLVPPELAARYLRASDACLVPLGSAAELRKFVPSKLFDCCAIGRPTIVSAEGEAVRLATDAKAALCIAPEDAAALTEAVCRLREDSDLRERLAQNGREFARSHRREDGVERFEQILDRAATGGR